MRKKLEIKRKSDRCEEKKKKKKWGERYERKSECIL